MSVGSAASLRLPQVPLSPHPLARRRQRFVVVPDASGAIAPPRFSPLQMAADDPPRGRILLASRSATITFDVQRLLRDSGYRVVGPASSAEEVERLVERRAAPGHIDCALIDLALPGAEKIADRLADERIAFAWLAPQSGSAMPLLHPGAPILHLPCDRGALLAAIDQARRPADGRASYPVPPPQPVWPRVFPQL
jgi:hypothetical protein